MPFLARICEQVRYGCSRIRQLGRDGWNQHSAQNGPSIGRPMQVLNGCLNPHHAEDQPQEPRAFLG